MTALKKYQKLECPGLWRDAPEAQRREVVVNFGETSLVLGDPRNDQALAHWSLPALERLNPGEVPALYSPAEDGYETLELEDPDMIAALETVRGALEAVKPHPGRLRNSILGGISLLVVGLGLFWLPGALVMHTVSVVPPATRTEIGRMALEDVIRVAGAPCADPAGQRAAERLALRLFGPSPPTLLILREGVAGAVHLPDRQVLLSRALVEGQDGPEALAGFALAERARAEAMDPLILLLEHAGTRATFGLLTTGALSQDAVEGYAEKLLRTEPETLETAALLDRFSAADLSSTPYAFALDPTGESVLPLVEGDPFRQGSPRPVLPDGDWISLQAICSE